MTITVENQSPAAISVEVRTAPYKTLYHVFTHSQDDWFSDYDTAKEVFDQFSADYGSARLYEEIYATRDDYENSMEMDESCLESFGEYPF